MNRTGTNRARAPLDLRRHLHWELQLLILPGIIIALVAMLAMHGCAVRGDGSIAFAGNCSPQKQMNCICKTPGVISFAVEGMGCPNCAKELQEVIAAVPGVKAAKVCFENNRAFVTLDTDHPATMEAIETAVAKRQEERLKLESDPNCVKSKG